MNVKKYLTTFLIAGILVAFGCVEPYTAPLSKNTPDLLVVDGFLNITDGEVVVVLSRTMPLGDLSDAATVDNATISLESSDNQSTELDFHGEGTYMLTGLSIDDSKTYRIRIATDLNHEYVSEFVGIKQTPEIDSVTWKPTGENIEVDVHTHDPTGNSRYYLWTFDETWQYRAYFATVVKWVEGEVKIRNFPKENITDCWNDDQSSKILIGSSVRLSEDVIHALPIQYIPKGDQKLSVEYSIMVNQTVISQTTYDFYKDLRKTTEETGGLFDPQPGRVLGNIKSVSNPDEAVLGIFNAGTVTKKRLFIPFSDLPRSFQVPQYSECSRDTIAVENLDKFDDAHFNIVDGVYQGVNVVAWTYSAKVCTDCRSGGGINQKPDFWP